ncbi:15202_t:CDS:2 [Entrophospora sp. SA101]|nr:15202_t:CDS:2 [Entrophospora sp. SA101]CAJ0843886.1 9681_t:CDS:2 [Entrophospora sp. SA101]
MYDYKSASDYLYELKCKETNNDKMIKQIAMIYFYIIDKFLEDPFDENGKSRDLSKMDHAIIMTAPIIRILFNDVLDDLELCW